MSHDGDKHIRKELGYSKAATWLAQDADNETLLFRKFDRLSIVNLLYLQSEILEIEKRLGDIDFRTAHGYDMDVKDAARTWETLIANCQSDKPPRIRQEPKSAWPS